jgi:nitric oxide reductase activation protein
MGYGVNAMTLFKPDDLDSVLKKWHRRLRATHRWVRFNALQPVRRSERVFRLDLE